MGPFFKAEYKVLQDTRVKSQLVKATEDKVGDEVSEIKNPG